MTVRYFRKKPAIVRAVKVDFNSEESREDILRFMLDTDCQFERTKDGLLISTLEGSMLARPGSWIIRGIKGECYPCDPEVFDITYEEVVPIE